LSANGVTIAFTNYLDKRTKGSSIRWPERWYVNPNELGWC
jgi:hypothetical protein